MGVAYSLPVDGIEYGFRNTITNQSLSLPMRMTTAQKDQFLTFFNTTVRGMSELFVYTDPLGRPVTARFAERSLTGLLEKAYNSWEITVPLRVFGGSSYWPSSGIWLWASFDRLLWPGGQTMGAY